MKYIEIVADAGNSDTVRAIAEKNVAQDFHLGVVDDDGRQSMRMLIGDDKLQAALDALQNIFGAQPTARIVVIAVESSLPKIEDEKKPLPRPAVASREALYESVEKSIHLNIDFLVLVVLSTLVAAIGLIENNVAVLIGAMVIAPLLGPNLALSLGTALGDFSLVRRAVATLFVGLMLAVVLSAGIGILWPIDISGVELIARTEAGLDSVALALASGAAAALSITTGLSSVLVGVMVAVAILPPAATVGIMLGQGELTLAIGAILLLAVNIVCVNLASKVVFYIKGIHPRTGLEKEKAKRAVVVYVLTWIVALIVLIVAIYGRESLSS